MAGSCLLRLGVHDSRSPCHFSAMDQECNFDHATRSERERYLYLLPLKNQSWNRRVSCFLAAFLKQIGLGLSQVEQRAQSSRLTLARLKTIWTLLTLTWPRPELKTRQCLKRSSKNLIPLFCGISLDLDHSKFKVHTSFHINIYIYLIKFKKTITLLRFPGSRRTHYPTGFFSFGTSWKSKLFKSMP